MPHNYRYFGHSSPSSEAWSKRKMSGWVLYPHFLPFGNRSLGGIMIYGDLCPSKTFVVTDLTQNRRIGRPLEQRGSSEVDRDGTLNDVR